MSKVTKQKIKLAERILALELELKSSLQKKAGGPAISVPKFTAQIQTLKRELTALG